MKTIVVLLLLLSMLGCGAEYHRHRVRYPGEVIVIENHRGIHRGEYREHHEHYEHRHRR